MKTRILLADDHKMIRAGLSRLLADHDDFEVVGQAANGRTAVELAQQLSPDVVVMDARMPDLNGVDATQQIAHANPSIRVIGLSAHSDHRTAGDMLRAGAAGYVVKDAAFEELVGAIRAVVNGNIYLSPSITGVIVGDYVNSRSSATPTSPFPILSGREREVLQLVAEGKATREVAEHLHVSIKTVESHRRNLMQKLNVGSVAELTKYAIREGITSL